MTSCVPKLDFSKCFLLAGISQPTYVNMHELASMAANKAQAQDAASNLPPPPAEFTAPSNEKVS